MNVTFSRNLTDRKRIMKSISPVLELTGDRHVWIKGPCSVMKPKLQISRRAFQQNSQALLDVNYCTIDETGRSYFIDDIQMENDGIVTYSLTCDVLYTYREQLISTYVLAIRSEKEGTSLYTDPEYAIRSNKLYRHEIIGYIPDEAGASNNNYIMTVAGG